MSTKVYQIRQTYSPYYGNRHITSYLCSEGKTKLICKGEKFKHIINSSEKVFYGGNTQFSYNGCKWIEKQSEKTG